MAVGAALTQKGITEIDLNTEAAVSMEGLKITGVHLTISGTVAGISQDEFNAITKEAEKNCLISQALSIPITSEAKLG
ncbi:OsmC-like protein [compost metagenome]